MFNISSRDELKVGLTLIHITEPASKARSIFHGVVSKSQMENETIARNPSRFICLCRGLGMKKLPALALGLSSCAL